MEEIKKINKFRTIKRKKAYLVSKLSKPANRVMNSSGPVGL